MVIKVIFFLFRLPIMLHKLFLNYIDESEKDLKEFRHSIPILARIIYKLIVKPIYYTYISIINIIYIIYYVLSLPFRMSYKILKWFYIVILKFIRRLSQPIFRLFYFIVYFIKYIIYLYNKYVMQIFITLFIIAFIKHHELMYPIIKDFFKNGWTLLKAIFILISTIISIIIKIIKELFKGK